MTRLVTQWPQLKTWLESIRLRHSSCVALLLPLLICLVTKGATLPDGFTETQVVTGLDYPTAMAFTPDGRILVCEQGGQLRVVKNGVLLSTPFLSVPVDSQGERGLVGVARVQGDADVLGFLVAQHLHG